MNFLQLRNHLGIQYGIHPHSMISSDSVYFGYAPNWDPSVLMTDLNQATGQKGATYNVYSQLTPDNVKRSLYDGNYQYPTDDIISSGAVLIASLMPTVNWTDITPSLCESVASFFESSFSSEGVTVWLRFAHEMNYYAAVGQYPGGSNHSNFMIAWKNMHKAISHNKKIYMFWSPNLDTPSEPVAPWWPGKQYVDIVGMDYYPNADEGLPHFATAYGRFYDTYAAAYELPFAIGETGTQLSTHESASTAQREEWLQTVLNPRSSGLVDSYAKYYMSCTWFEYGPPAHEITFYVVYNQSGDVVEATASNTENGRA
ncbi:glycoside hydrolase [Aspergillus cavernicola]|uniref:Glycoside hydrolase n=1 Tax=Aspergillus cavernicola TaxID=176166 RepID=A0ABR4II21_9EURO